jgi:hypothetical protein
VPPANSSAGGKQSTTGVPNDPNSLELPMVGSPPSALKELPPLRDAPAGKREALFIQKLQLCGVIFSFDDPGDDKRGKDMKRQTLLELVDYAIHLRVKRSSQSR